MKLFACVCVAVGWAAAAEEQRLVVRTSNRRVLRSVRDAHLYEEDIRVVIEPEGSSTAALFLGDAKIREWTPEQLLGDPHLFAELKLTSRRRRLSASDVETWGPATALGPDVDLLFLPSVSSGPRFAFPPAADAAPQRVRVFPNAKSAALRSQFLLDRVFKPLLVSIRNSKVVSAAELSPLDDENPLPPGRD